MVVEDGCLQALLHILPIHIRLHCLLLLGRVLLIDTPGVSQHQNMLSSIHHNDPIHSTSDIYTNHVRLLY